MMRGEEKRRGIGTKEEEEEEHKKGDRRRRDDKKCENLDPRDKRRERDLEEEERVRKALTDADLFYAAWSFFGGCGENLP